MTFKAAETDDMDKHDPHSPHRRAWDAIPWFVAGSAGAAERALLQQHLPQCADCRSELQFQQQVRAAMRAGAPAPADPEPALQRLLARIDAAASADVPPAQVAPAPRARSSPSWTRWLVAAVVLQSVGLGAAMLSLRGPGRDAEFRTLSTPAAAAPRPMLLLVPAPGMDFAALRQALGETGLAIVEIAPDAGSLGLTAQDGRWRTAQDALPRLRSLPGVLLAEPTGHAR
jgi:hypothetical protein